MRQLPICVQSVYLIEHPSTYGRYGKCFALSCALSTKSCRTASSTCTASSCSYRCSLCPCPRSHSTSVPVQYSARSGPFKGQKFCGLTRSVPVRGLTRSLSLSSVLFALSLSAGSSPLSLSAGSSPLSLSTVSLARCRYSRLWTCLDGKSFCR